MKSKILWLMVIILVVALSACGGGPGTEEEEAAPTEQPAETSEEPMEESVEEPAEEPMEEAAEEPTEEMMEEAETGPELAAELSVFNWDDYIDEELLTAYEETYGVTIIYDTFASNEDLLAKLQAGATGYDVIFPSDYMVSQMIELGLLAEIDVNDLSNWSNIDPQFADAPFDPGNQHCVPYQWGTTGIVILAWPRVKEKYRGE